MQCDLYYMQRFWQRDLFAMWRFPCRLHKTWDLMASFFFYYFTFVQYVDIYVTKAFLLNAKGCSGCLEGERSFSHVITTGSYGTVCWGAQTPFICWQTTSLWNSAIQIRLYTTTIHEKLIHYLTFSKTVPMRTCSRKIRFFFLKISTRKEMLDWYSIRVINRCRG